LGLPPVQQNRRQRRQHDHSDIAMTENNDPYDVLGVTMAATPAEISYAFRAKVRFLHPDTRDGDSAGAVGETQLHRLIAAYHVLRDPEQRAEHDRSAAARQQRRGPSSSPDRRIASYQAPLTIPVTHHRRRAPIGDYPLWAGPVRRHW
jgi:curved DNA-binding protein CbpA